MNKDFFYNNLDKKFLSKDKEEFLDNLKKYSETNKKQIYVLEKPLLGKENYSYKEATAVFIPKKKIYFFNFNTEKEEEFEDYVADYIEDIGYISDKYEYKNEIGRPRIWKELFIEKLNYSKNNLKNMLSSEENLTEDDVKKIDLLTSLATGSINDILRVSGRAENLLEKIKKRIILFDADQTKFIYEDIPDKEVRIQGLAGTGKTELLLHKLKELYLKDNSTKIAITCHNKVLKESLKKRIPEFFNFMKVEEQIKWNERLWCVSSWGSRLNKDSEGLYSFIANFYDINFYSFSNSKGYDFKEICQKAIEELELKNIAPFFDYILIDESQDFSEEFIKLCKIITKEKVYIAGDIFQSIFNTETLEKVKADFLLNKCYRTDPKTLMFAHSLGMGLFEKEKISWLDENGWKACGYEVEKVENSYTLTRNPLRRFEDIDSEKENTVEIFSLKKDDKILEYSLKIFDIIENIKEKFPTVLPDDIAVIFLEDSKYNYALMDTVAEILNEVIGWKSNKGYETKKKIENTIFISNKNNIKGLEFPFIICVSTDPINSDLILRNALYMIITRSFLKTYFLFSDKNTDEFKNSLKLGLKNINEGKIKVEIPTEEEQKKIRNNIKMLQESSKKSLDQKIDDEIKKLDLKKQDIKKLKELLYVKIDNDNNIFDEERIKELIEKCCEILKM
jgi:putative ATP-dependent helicase